MKKLFQKFFFLILGILIIAGSLYFFAKSEVDKYSKIKNLPQTEELEEKILIIGEKRLMVEIADTDEKRVRGLSGRTEIPEGRGLFFIFDTPGNYGIWMRDMQFSIDIVWLDENFLVVGLEKNVSPETFPEVFYPERQAKYILEIASGEAEKFDIDIGTYMYFED